LSIPVKVLIIGYGSIGRRHARNLIEMKVRPYIVTRHPDNLNADFFRNINEVKERDIGYCIIASPTARHLADLKKLQNLRKRFKGILIEKPLECSLRKAKAIKDLAGKENIRVAYNLRFVKAFDLISAFLRKQKKKVRIVEIAAGQDLREWRPYQHITQSYSAFRRKGGGVDLDLSHEVDYALWLFKNNFKSRLIYRKKISSLKINSPDIFKIILGYNKFVVDISLDYIRSPKERYLKIICEGGNNLTYNFITGELRIGDKLFLIKQDFSDSYKKMLRAFLKFDKQAARKLCSLEEAVDVLRTIGV